MVPDPSEPGADPPARLNRRETVRIGVVSLLGIGVTGCSAAGDDGTPTATVSDQGTGPTGTPTASRPRGSATQRPTGTPTDSPIRDGTTPPTLPPPKHVEVPMGSFAPGELENLRLDEFDTFRDPQIPLSEFEVYTGEAQAEGGVWLRWDDHWLYFAARVPDETFVTDNGSGMSIWKNDAFQIGIAPGEPGDTDNFAELNIGQQADGTPILTHELLPAGKDARVIECAETHVEYTNGTAEFAFAVPFSVINRDLEPADETDFSLTVVHHDPDAAEENWRHYGGGLLGGKEPYGLGTATWGNAPEPLTGPLEVPKGQIDVTDFATRPEPTRSLRRFNVYAGNATPGNVWLRWDDERFYFAAEHCDPTFVDDAGTGAEGWQNDAWQVALAPGMPGEVGGFALLTISATPDGPTLWLVDQPLDDLSREIEDADLSVDHDAGETTMAFAVAWSTLPYEFTPEPGRKFSLTIAQHDPGETESWRTIGGGVLGEKEPYGLGLARFVA